MEETNKASAIHEPLQPSNLIDLYKHYWSALQQELGFCFQYLNFYIGLLSALLAATLAGLLSIKFGDLRGLALLLGPALIFVLAWNGYETIETFYLYWLLSTSVREKAPWAVITSLFISVR